MNTKIEVLAPAGNPDGLRAAVYAGADAVYMGGALFSARASAANFSREEMREAVRFARARGVRVHVTVNTLLRDAELPEALDFCRFLCSIPVDAVLVQDMGLFRLLRAACPALPIHASTQMSLHTPLGAALLEELGAERVVLAREMSLKEIEAVRAATGVELEAFVHGALCMCLSGQCYFSAMLGGRSGNRGRCAQPCRLPFSAQGGTGHDLSLKDLSFIEHIDALQKAGVCSAKIEGRMKRPEYVAAATAACRRAADGEAVPADLMQSLRAVFSRSGFTDGYLTENRGREMFGTRTKEDVEGASGAVLGALHGLYKNELQRVPVRFTLELFAGEVPRLTAKSGDAAVVIKGDAAAEAARQLPVDAARFEAQLKKTGGTPFLCESACVCTDEKSVLPISAVNALRRAAVEALLEKRAEKPPIPFSMPPLDVRPHKAERLRLRGRFASAEQMPKNADVLESVILPLETPVSALEAIRDGGQDVILELPRAMFGAEDAVRDMVRAVKAEGFSDFYAGNLGAVALCRAENVSAHGGFSLNVFNTACLEEFEALGLSDTELSMELSGAQMRDLGGNLRRGALVYGRQPLMLTRCCPLANAPGGCQGCTSVKNITDRRGAQFPVTCTRLSGRFLYAEVLNSVPLVLLDRLSEPFGADFGVLRFTVENAVETEGILRCAMRHEMPQCDYTRGLFTRGVQ